LSLINFDGSLHNHGIELPARLFSEMSQYGLGIPGATARRRRGHGVEVAVDYTRRRG